MMEKTPTTVPYNNMSTKSPGSGSLISQCCYCFSLRTGCFILGYLNLAFNTFHTLALLTLTTYIGITTHGFDHFDPDVVQRSGSTFETDRPLLTQIGVLLVIVLCANVTWLVVTIACLVGLHKKRPGPIRVYIGFAIARLLFSMFSFGYMINSSKVNAHTVLTHVVDLGLAVYFILVYFFYASQLDKERAAEESSQITATVTIVYPEKIYTKHLVDV